MPVIPFDPVERAELEHDRATDLTALDKFAARENLEMVKAVADRALEGKTLIVGDLRVSRDDISVAVFEDDRFPGLIAQIAAPQTHKAAAQAMADLTLAKARELVCDALLDRDLDDLVAEAGS